MKNMKAKVAAAWKSWTAWVLGLGLALTEMLPYAADSLPLVREAFDEDGYRIFVRIVLIAGIVLRVRTVKSDDK